MQWLMLQQEIPKDYVIATGRTKTVREFIELCALKIGWNKIKKGLEYNGKEREKMKLDEE